MTVPSSSLAFKIRITVTNQNIHKFLAIPSGSLSLQRAEYGLSQIAKYYTNYIYKHTKDNDFKWRNPVGSKILMNAKILKQVSHFIYLERDVSFKFDEDTEKKVNRF